MNKINIFILGKRKKCFFFFILVKQLLVKNGHFFVNNWFFDQILLGMMSLILWAYRIFEIKWSKKKSFLFQNFDEKFKCVGELGCLQNFLGRHLGCLCMFFFVIWDTTKITKNHNLIFQTYHPFFLRKKKQKKISKEDIPPPDFLRISLILSLL